MLKPQAVNRIAVRVLNPSYEPIDGIVLGQTPRRNKTHPYSPGSDYNYGGITDSVELLVAAPVRVEDLFVRPDPKTGLDPRPGERAQRRHSSRSRAGSSSRSRRRPAARASTRSNAAATSRRATRWSRPSCACPARTCGT